jgi:hypothetical protein
MGVRPFKGSNVANHPSALSDEPPIRATGACFGGLLIPTVGRKTRRASAAGHQILDSRYFAAGKLAIVRVRSGSFWQEPPKSWIGDKEL